MDQAGRCAQLLHLRRPSRSESGGTPRPSELLVANVHLLFPHNAAAQRIRVRRVHKLLAYIDEYKASLSDQPPPALICGDFNGDADSTVVQFLQRYGWQCSFSLHQNASEAQEEGGGSSSSSSRRAAAAVTPPTFAANSFDDLDLLTAATIHIATMGDALQPSEAHRRRRLHLDALPIRPKSARARMDRFRLLGDGAAVGTARLHKAGDRVALLPSARKHDEQRD